MQVFTATLNQMLVLFIFMALVLYSIGTNWFWRIKFPCIFVTKPCNTAVLLHFANFDTEKFYFRQNCFAPENEQFFCQAHTTKRKNTGVL